MNEISPDKIKNKVSICALAYNHVNYLDDFFKGVLNQNIPGYRQEIIIGVDTCNDGTLEKCIEYKEKYPEKIKLIIHTDHVGMMKNAIDVYENADGEYIAFCECDDYWIDENKLSAQLDLLVKNKNAGICFTDIKILKSNTGVFEKNWATITKQKYSLKDIIRNHVISTCTVLMKNNIDHVILNNLIKFPVGDLPLYVMSMSKDNSSAVYLDKITTIYRHHDRGFHSTKSTLQRLEINNSVYKGLLEILTSPKIKKLITKELTRNFYSMGIFQTDKYLARKNYRSSMKKWSVSNIKYPLFSSFKFLKSFLIK